MTVIHLMNLEACSDRSTLLLSHKIHNGAVSVVKDKYLNPAQSSKVIRTQSAKYCRYQTYCDSLKNLFFSQTIPHWPSVVTAETTEELWVLVI